jgi:hypothetical protein
MRHQEANYLVRIKKLKVCKHLLNFINYYKLIAWLQNTHPLEMSIFPITCRKLTFKVIVKFLSRSS